MQLSFHAAATPTSRVWRIGFAIISLLACLSGARTAPAADANFPARYDDASSAITLKAAYDAAWARQPEARSASAREEAARARQEIAQSWTAEPAAVHLSEKSDRLNRNAGAREHEIGLAIPLWLPGERSGVRSVAEAQLQSASARSAAARLRTSAAVREAYWTWERARVDLAVAHDRLDGARAIAADVAKRVRAGDLSRADQHQAQGSVAAADAAVAESTRTLVSARQALRSVTGLKLQSHEPAGTGTAVPTHDAIEPEPLPVLPANFDQLDASHPAIVDLLAQVEVARRSMDLARTQTRANPELLLATTRERPGFGEPALQTLTFGVRIPLGSDARYRAKVAAASIEAIEAESQLRIERERVLAGLEGARQHVEAAKAQLDAARERARLARETRGFFEKSFRAGETNLPTRLRVELEASEAARLAARAEIDHADAISALRQALGLLPE